MTGSQGTAPTCEWPVSNNRHHVTALQHKCGRPAKVEAFRATPNGGWERLVCGVHGAVAKRRDWVLRSLPA